MAQLAEPVLTRSVPDTPYVGLGYYTEEYAAVFFGREDERKKIIGNLRASRLTLFYAESGVGKSSLLRAGVVARLHELARESMSERGTARYIPVVFNAWRAEPRVQLIAAIEEAIAPYVTTGAPVNLPRETLDAAIGAAADAVDATLLLILDQFEDYLLYRSPEALLADDLARCVNSSELRTNILIAIREDAYAGLGDLFKGRLANVYANYLHLEYLDKDAAREAIEKPIERFNEAHDDEEPVVIEPALVDAVLEQVARGRIVIGESGLGTLDGEPGDSRYVETPYLQLVMQRIWETEREAGSRTLRAATLDSLGGADTIIRDHLDRAMEDFSAAQRQELAAAFKFLVTPSGTKIALSAADLAQFADVPQSDLAEDLEKLAGDMRILRPIAPVRPGDPTRYEIYHDSLAPAFLAWHRVQAEKRLEAEKAAAERKALDEKARARKFRAVAIGACVLLVVALVAAALASVQSRRLTTAKKANLSRTLAAKAQADLTSPEDAIPLAAQAYHTSQTLEARSAVLAVAHHFARLRGVLTPRVPQGYATVAYSPRGEWIAVGAAGGSRNSIDIWSGGHYVRSLTGHADEVKTIAFDPKRPTLLAAASADGTVRIWDVESGRLLKKVRIKGVEQDALAYDPDGTLLAAGGTDGVVRLWSLVGGLPSGAPRRLISDNRVEGFTIQAMAFDRQFLAVGGRDGNYDGFIEIYHSDVKPPVTDKLAPAEGSGVTALAFDPTLADRLLSGSDNGKLDDWTIGGGGTNIRNEGHWTGASDRISELAFSPDGQKLVTPSADGTITFWTGDGRRIGEPVQLAAAVDGAAFSGDGATVAAVGGGGGMVTLWDAGRQLRLGWRIDYGDAFVSDLAFAHAASGGDPVKLVVLRDIVHDNDSITSYLDVWTVGDATRFNLNPPCARPNCTEYPVLRDLNLALALSPSNDRLAVTSSNGSVLLYDLGGKATTHATLRPSSPSTDTTYDAAFDRTGTMLAAVAGKNLVVWRLHGMRAVGKPIVLHSPSSMLAVAFSPVSPLVATGGRDGRVELWNLTTRKPTSLGFHTGRVNGLAFSPDGATLATAGDDGRVILWDVEKRKNLGSLRVRAPATSVAFSADGRTLAVGTEAVGGDGNIFLWDLATREQLGEPYEGLDSMWAVAFSPDGTMVAGGNADGSVYLWGPQAWATKVAPLAANLCAALGRYLTRDDWNRYVGGQPKKTCPS